MKLRLRFETNSAYTLLIAVRAHGRNEPVPGWNRFLDRLRRTRPGLYYELAGLPQRALFIRRQADAARPDSRSRPSRQILQAPLVSKLLLEAEHHREEVRLEWLRNQLAIERFLDQIGVRLEGRIRCFIVHPGLRQGAAIDKNKIVWGHLSEFPNYSSVYICHEILHTVTGLDGSPVTHAIIELAADNELRVRLNGGGRYFEYPGHDELAPLTRKLLPAWRSFLRTGRRNLRAFIEKTTREHGRPSEKTPKAA